MSLEAFMNPEVLALILAGSVIGYLFGILPGSGRCRRVGAFRLPRSLSEIRSHFLFLRRPAWSSDVCRLRSRHSLQHTRRTLKLRDHTGRASYSSPRSRNGGPCHLCRGNGDGGFNLGGRSDPLSSVSTRHCDAFRSG